MKKQIILLAAATLLASAGFAQTARNAAQPSKSLRHTTPAATVLPTIQSKAAGDTVTAFPWTEGFESATLTGFSFIDADADNNNWMRVTLSTNNFTPRSGDGLITSASWTSDDGALTPDNWMILPTFTLPADASEFTLSWYEAGQDPDYASEYYSVYIATTGRAVANFTATTAVYSGTATDTYVKKSVSLSSYAGQTINIAFRHHNCTDEFYLNIDDIRVGGGETPEVSLDGPAAIALGTPATFTATGASVFEWAVDGTVQTETGSTLSYTFDAAGNHVVRASATNSVGTGADSVIVNVYDCGAPIATFPYEEGFEGNIDCWSTLTLDATSTGFRQLSNQSYAHSGNACMLGAYSDDSDVDQWLISPLIALPADAANISLKYYVLLTDWEGVYTNYEVRIATNTAIDTANFGTVLFSETGVSDDYVSRTIDISSYAGDTVRIAFRNITAMTGDAMFLDDIYIGAPLLPDLAINGPEEVSTNSEQMFIAVSDASDIVWTVDNVQQSATGDTLVTVFTTPGAHVVAAVATNSVGSTTASLNVNAVECNANQIPYTIDLSNGLNVCWENDGWDATEYEGRDVIYSLSNFYGFMDLNPDNWIFTPYVTVPESGSFEVAWSVMTLDAELPSDHYGVYVVSGDNATLLFNETLTAADASWRNRHVALPEGISGDVRIAFRHYETTGGYAVLVSNIEVSAAGTHEGINNADADAIAIYPNPANSILNIEGDGILSVQLLDVSGRTVATAAAGSIDLSNLASGIYFVRVLTANGATTSKIVKK